MLTVPEVARRLGRNPETIRRWIREGKLRSRRIGTQYLIDEGDLHPMSADEGHRVQEVAARYWAATAPAAAVPPDRWLTTIVGRLVRAFDPARIVLFGSRANGRATEDADYELLIVLDEVEDRRAARMAVRRALDDLPISKEVSVASLHDGGASDADARGLPGWPASEGLTLYERA